MRKNARDSGIDIIGDVTWGTHFCQFYQTREDLIDILVPYFKAGLENNEFCVWVTSQPREIEEAKEVLKCAVPDIDDYLDKGQMEIIPYTYGYLKEDNFDPEEAVNNWVEKINQALAKGYDGLRAAGSNNWLKKEGWRTFVDYESKIDAIIEKYNVISLCPYYLDVCSAAEIIDVVSNHQFALIKRKGEWERIENSGRRRAEKQAIQAAKNWEHTFDAVPDLIAIIDDKYRIVRVNRAMAAKLELTPEECAGLTCYRVIHGTENPPSFCPNEKLFNAAEYTVEFFEDCLGGYFSVSASPLHDPEGRFIGSVYIAHDINERKQEEHRIRRYNRILEGINQIFSNAVQAKTEEEVGEACLSVALEITGSQFGFINAMGADGLLHDVAKSELGWEQCVMYDKTGHRCPPSIFAVHGLYSSVIDNGKGFFTNDPPLHPDSIGIPDGHPQITSFLGVPLIQEGDTIGLIAVANREGGYSSEQQEDLEAITPAVVQVLQREKAEQKRKQAEKALQASEERYRSLYENSLDGIFLTKPDGTILCANPQACQMFGMTEDEIIQTGREGTVVNDEKLAAALEERNLTGRMRAELMHKRKDGSTFICDTTSKLFVDADGNLNSSLIIRDISERKKTEEALRASEEKFRQIVETANEGIWLIDSNEKTTFINLKMSEMLGYSVEEILGQSPRNYISPEFHEKFNNRLHENIERINQQVVDCRFIRKDGSELWCIVSSSSLFDGLGKYAGSLAMIANITERKKAEEALKKARENLEEKVKERTAELEMAYESLKVSETGLAEAQKMAHIGNWDLNLLTGEGYWSSELYRIFGRSPEESAPSYNELLNYIHPDNRDYVDKSIQNGLKKEPEKGIEYRIVLSSGEERTVHSQAEVIFDKHRVPVRVKGIVQDITERKKTEERIRILANAVESSNDAIVTLSFDGMITSWNRAAEHIYGYPVEEVIGKDVSILEPDNIKGEIKQFSERIKQGKKVQHYETLRLRKDGTIINVSVTLSPVFDLTGKLVAISGIIRDITERIRAEEALRESEARLRQFYESDMIGVFYYNLDGSIFDANDKFLEIVGYMREDLQAGEINWNMMTSPEYNPHGGQCIAELKTIGVKEPKEKEYIRKDGSRIPVIVGSATFDKVHNEGTAFVLDITEKKKAEEALANIEVTRKKEIHHRIKNNLQVISSLLDLQAEKFDNPKVIEAFRESQNRVISMALIHEELYKGEGTDTLNFCEYIRELAESLFQSYSLNSKDILLKMDLEENALFNMDVAVPLGIIVNELISNSLKHAFQGRDGGEIGIKLRKQENENRQKNEEYKKEGDKTNSFILTVSDNGIGVSENLEIEDLDTLGMQLITALVDQLDGKLELKRNNGTEFSIRFKVTEEK
ncbi:PAS domain S-box protein [Methanosarcina hadiensis]|uniref:PAS domain S-box protein n=1 Tax=Methanosarcina hadiensis TaxID=3078083 RepID=UPI00397740CA